MDGRVTDDTNPYDGKEEIVAKPKKKEKKTLKQVSPHLESFLLLAEVVAAVAAVAVAPAETKGMKSLTI